MKNEGSYTLFVEAAKKGAGDGKMLKMSQIETIKDLQGKGLGPVAIVERLQLDRKTVSKYIVVETFENKKPTQSYHPGGTLLAIDPGMA
jgi:hypothetical protein